MPAKLKNGVTGAPGGAREGSGRKPSEFLAKCRQIASSPKYFKWAERVLADEPTEDRLIVVNNVPQIEKVRASAGEKDRVWSSLAAYGFGKPSQPVELSGEVSGRIVVIRAGA
jgi:hypothetical protein